MSRKRRSPTKIRVPNPDKPVRGRLKTPAHQRHKSKRDYERRPKHPGRVDE